MFRISTIMKAKSVLNCSQIKRVFLMVHTPFCLRVLITSDILLCNRVAQLPASARSEIGTCICSGENLHNYLDSAWNHILHYLPTTFVRDAYRNNYCITTLAQSKPTKYSGGVARQRRAFCGISSKDDFCSAAGEFNSRCQTITICNVWDYLLWVWVL